MRLLFTYVSRRYLSCVETGHSMSQNCWKSYKILRHNNVQTGIMFPYGIKSTVKSSGLIWEQSRRYVHNSDIVTIIEHEKMPNLSIFGPLMVNINSLYLIAAVDRKFRLKDFIRGAEQALTYVTRNLVNQNESALNDTITPACLESLLKKTKLLNDEQKRLMLVQRSVFSYQKVINLGFQYPKNGSDYQPLVVDALFLRLEYNLKLHEKVSLDNIQMKQFLIEFKRLYGKQINSPWMVSNLVVNLVKGLKLA